MHVNQLLLFFSDHRPHEINNHEISNSARKSSQENKSVNKVEMSMLPTFQLAHVTPNYSSKTLKQIFGEKKELLRQRVVLGEDCRGKSSYESDDSSVPG